MEGRKRQKMSLSTSLQYPAANSQTLKKPLSERWRKRGRGKESQGGGRQKKKRTRGRREKKEREREREREAQTLACITPSKTTCTVKGQTVAGLIHIEQRVRASER